ncbi:hypothetical protein F4695_004496 [Rhizobium soli]|uniref:Uncharacterized protein n=1 Tax=Rhizobium soli TaxID=424798 RepID=A0A7X0MW82_9HYPH|nr:hypothetical protein [Rhizobium soli]MBB6511098.1 hypothetical protein [Rhizobium soli]
MAADVERSEQAQIIKRTVISLAKAVGPDRSLDAEIASILGWTSRQEQFEERRTGETKIRHLWFKPDGQLDKVPRFTWNLDVALDLVQSMNGSSAGGFGWEATSGSSKMRDFKPVLASTPILALCIQALLLKLRQLP